MSSWPPSPPCLEDEHTEEWVRDKTIYLGLFSRYDGRAETKAACRETLAYPGTQAKSGQPPTFVTVINGNGGNRQQVAYWEEVAELNPGCHLHLVGRLDRDASAHGGVRVAGYQADTYPYLKAADIIVGSGGTNTMCEVSAVAGRFLSLPEQRPFNEQIYKMRALERYGLTRAIRADIAPADWAKWFRRAGDLQPRRWRRLRNSATLGEAIAQLSAAR